MVPAVFHLAHRPRALALKGERGVVEKNPIYARTYILSRARFRALVSTLDNALKKNIMSHALLRL